ncbi:zinc finger CCCH domain-containing protein 44-like [Hibiscus syriacus]|uniref:zinc finger CCCH domain-containing protein 44-like n=1 Tax=Hibiscus syriacus TaxID=106335 RepID=UPI001922F265|nr:zinc finger CCCH domain-containing protein 44-like [Hibiscus syriacus]
MSKDKGKQKLNEEAEGEDWCFVCKDGGKLLLCDHKGCGKVYHPTCVGKRNSVLKSEGRWTCPRHSCAECGGPPRYFCLMCPDSVCRLCVKAYEFVPVKLNKGLCKTCFELSLLAEMNAEVDSEGDKLHFQDTDSSDFMFKDYLLIIMEQEELKFDDLRHAQSETKNYESGLDCDKIKDKDAIITISDVDRESTSASDDSFGKRRSPRRNQGKRIRYAIFSKLILLILWNCQSWMAR